MNSNACTHLTPKSPPHAAETIPALKLININTHDNILMKAKLSTHSNIEDTPDIASPSTSLPIPSLIEKTESASGQSSSSSAQISSAPSRLREETTPSTSTATQPSNIHPNETGSVSQSQASAKTESTTPPSNHPSLLAHAEQSATKLEALLKSDGSFAPDWWTQYESLKSLGATLKKFKSPESLAKSYGELERMRHYPDPTDETKMNRYRQSLGMPSLEEYVLNKPESLNEETPLWDPTLVEKMRQTAYTYAVPMPALEALTQTYVNECMERAQTEADDYVCTLADQQNNNLDMLTEQWGARCTGNLKHASSTLHHLCHEANIDPSAFTQDPVLGSHPDFIRLLHHVGTLLREPMAKGVADTPYLSPMDEARRMESDPTHPLHDAYMNYKHPNHGYANAYYDKLVLGK